MNAKSGAGQQPCGSIFRVLDRSNCRRIASLPKGICTARLHPGHRQRCRLGDNAFTWPYKVQTALVTFGVSCALSRRFADVSSKWQRTLVSEWPAAGKCPVVEVESLPWRKRHDANVNKTRPTKTGRSAIRGLLSGANDDSGAKPPEQSQDPGKGDCSGCGCGFRLRTNAENSVMTNPIGKG